MSRFDLRSTLLLAAGVFLRPTPAPAQNALGPGVLREGTLSFDGHATLGDFNGTTVTVTGEFGASAELGQVTGWVEAVVNTLRTGNGKRDRDLNKSMESDKYPTMRFELVRVSPEASSGDSIPAMLHGSLLIHGVSHEVDLPTRVLIKGSEVRIRSDFPLNLTDYQIGGLSKMLGILKMYPDIQVHVDVTFDVSPP